MTPDPPGTGGLRPAHLRRLQAVNVVSALDRAAIGPMLLLMASDLGVSVAEITLVASVYLLSYALGQPVWGLLSARLGTVRTLRAALLGAGVAGVLSALAPNLLALCVLRGVSGAFFGGLAPATLTYVGAMVPVERRQQPMVKLMTGVALGTAVAAACAGWAAQLATWRWAFAATAVASLALVLWLGRLPEPPRPAGRRGAVRLMLVALRDPWTLFVLLLAFVEGAAVTGVFTLVAPGIQESIPGGAGSAGSVVAVFGLAVLCFSRVVGPLSARVSTPALLATGGTFGALGFGLLAVDRSTVSGLVACVLIGAAWAFMHSTLQTWATSVAPGAQNQITALFASCLFLGGAAGVMLGSQLVDGSRYGVLFGVTAVAFVPLTVVATLGRARYLRSRRGR